ncbi:imidazoleglycerol-phosphate dehydratase [Desulfobacterium sp. N47]|uniref:Imidazoleglycerol-phosphate dehydratase n=1 Tax=uncultured Desulfobacterium sp. TaxID=201089 RepID=E1YKS9_9BACT|nr:Imidazoleglycerol-phosphate dehydratase [uncultured Desulfobacterium sp.]
MDRTADVDRKTNETAISIKLCLDGTGKHEIDTGIPFFNHMLSLFSAHGFFDLSIKAKGDIEVDFHHTVEDVGLVLGDALNKALGDRKGIRRYGHITVPMDDALTSVTVDLSNRPYMVYNVPSIPFSGAGFSVVLAREFFRAFSTRAGMNLHINVFYGQDEHHIIESVFKAAGRAIDQATSSDDRLTGICSTKGVL